MAVQLPDRLGEPELSRCLFCDEKLPNGFGETFGDNDDRAHRCPECDTFTRLKKGSAAGLKVANADPTDDTKKQDHVTPTNPVLADGGQEADR